MTALLVRTPAERARGTAAMQVSRRLAGLPAHGLMRLTVTGVRGRRVPRVRLPVTVASGRPAEVAVAGRVATRATVAGTAERIRLLLADHVRPAATRPDTRLPAAAADAGGPDR